MSQCNNTKAHFSVAANARTTESGYVQEVESNYSGMFSHVSSQLAMIPSSRSMLSRDKRLPLDTWNTSGLQENVFGNRSSIFESSRDHPQGIHSCAPQKERGSVPQATGSVTLFERDDKQSKDTIPMPTFARRPSTMGSIIPVDFPHNFMVGQQRQQISELQSDNFLITSYSWFRKYDPKKKVTTCLIFHRKQCYGSKKKNEMVVSFEN